MDTTISRTEKLEYFVTGNGGKLLLLPAAFLVVSGLWYSVMSTSLAGDLMWILAIPTIFGVLIMVTPRLSSQLSPFYTLVIPVSGSVAELCFYRTVYANDTSIAPFLGVLATVVCMASVAGVLIHSLEDVLYDI